MSRKMLLLLGILLVGGAAASPWLDVSTNCGGNSAALAAVGAYTTLARVGATDRPDRTFRVAAASASEREQLAQLPGASWLHHAHLLVSTAPVAAESTEHRVIIVCDTAYTNVPRRWFGSAPPSHAAGYADGSTGLINSAGFTALDRTSFIALDDLYPTNSR